MNTTYKEITVELKQKIAFAMMNSKSNAKLASSYGLGVSTLYKVVKGEQTKATGKTYKKLVALANNQGKLNTSSSTEKKGGVPTPPNRQSLLFQFSLIHNQLAMNCKKA